MAELSNFRVAVLATDGFEESELTEPMKALQDARASVTVVSLKPGEIQAFRHDTKTIKIKVDLTIHDIHAADFDGVQLPGGALNADTLRTVPKVKEFLHDMQEAGNLWPSFAMHLGCWYRLAW